LGRLRGGVTWGWGSPIKLKDHRTAIDLRTPAFLQKKLETGPRLSIINLYALTVLKRGAGAVMKACCEVVCIAAAIYCGSIVTAQASDLVAKCRQSPIGCYEQAARDCKGGPYQVLDSDSHGGGLLTDDLWSGPFIWYAMSYACGPSDGSLADFSFRGLRPRH
jgi:hypothetical protein